jgi:hypothetical protein
MCHSTKVGLLQAAGTPALSGRACILARDLIDFKFQLGLKRKTDRQLTDPVVLRRATMELRCLGCGKTTQTFNLTQTSAFQDIPFLQSTKSESVGKSGFKTTQVIQLDNLEVSFTSP